MPIDNTQSELTNLSQALRNIVSSSSHVIDAQAQNHAALSASSDSLKAFKKHLDTVTRGTNASATQIKKAEDAKKRELDLAKQKLEAEEEYLQLTKSGTATQQQLQQASAKVTLAQQRHQQAVGATTTSVQTLNKNTQPAGKSLAAVSKSGLFANFMLVKFGDALKGQADQIWTQHKASGGLVEDSGSLLLSYFKQQNDAFGFNVAGDVFAQATISARQMFNAMGGVTKGMEGMQEHVSALQFYAGSQEEGLRIAVESANYLAKQGIAPTTAALASYRNDLVLLSKQTGMSTAQAHAEMRAVSEDVEVLDQLRSARKDERAAILASQRALVMQAVATGMSTEQAKQAAAMLNKMVSAKPLDRLKQAAKVRALSGAMGIAGGEEAAQAITAGKRMSDQQRQSLMQFSQNAANMMDQAAGMGLGTEIFATTLMDKLDLDQYYGKGSPFSTTIGDTLAKPLSDVSKSILDTRDTLEGKIAQLLANIVSKFDILVSGKHWAGVAGTGIAAAIGLMLGGGKILGAISGMIAKALSIGGASAAGGAAAAAGGATATGGAAAASGAAAAATAGKVGARSALGAAGGAAAGVAIAAGALYGIDAVAGKMGVGEKKADATQDEANWRRMDTLEKLESSLGRGIEKLGSFVFLDNIAEEAKTKRVAAETNYLDKHEREQVRQIERTNKAGTNATNTDIVNTGLLDATKQTAQGIATQIKQNDTTSDLLRSLKDISEKQTALMEKQLIALTMTEPEKVDPAARSNLRRDNAFGARFNYV